MQVSVGILKTTNPTGVRSRLLKVRAELVERGISVTAQKLVELAVKRLDDRAIRELFPERDVA